MHKFLSALRQQKYVVMKYDRKQQHVCFFGFMKIKFSCLMIETEEGNQTGLKNMFHHVLLDLRSEKLSCATKLCSNPENISTDLKRCQGETLK